LARPPARILALSPAEGGSLFVLGIDTATPVTSAAIGSETGTLAAFNLRHDRGHARVLVPAVRWLLEQADLEPTALVGIAVGAGPGLFTGLRVGVSSAKALAQAWRCPMVAVSSLDLLAFANRYAHRTICAAIDARRGEVFATFYRQAPGGMIRIHEPQVMRPDELAAAIEARGEHVLLVGDGALAHRRVFARLPEQVDLGAPTQATPSAEALVELAVPRFQREEFVDPFEVTPMYLRRPDIDPSVGRRLAQGGQTETAMV
jgi:tRNA threonylcarbamoyladenosine biosynthesis protein TsaB